MKHTFALVFFTLIALALPGCRSKPEWRAADLPDQWRVTVERREVFHVPDDRIADMPHRTAVVVEKYPCCATLRTTRGEVLTIGGPAAPYDIVRFTHTLEMGETYTLPDAYHAFRQREQDNRPRPLAHAGR